MVRRDTDKADRRRSQQEPSEADRFSDLAKRLVRVPKKEIDAERERDEKRKR